MADLFNLSNKKQNATDNSSSTVTKEATIRTWSELKRSLSDYAIDNMVIHHSLATPKLHKALKDTANSSSIFRHEVIFPEYSITIHLSANKAIRILPSINQEAQEMLDVRLIDTTNEHVPSLSSCQWIAKSTEAYIQKDSFTQPYSDFLQLEYSQMMGLFHLQEKFALSTLTSYTISLLSLFSNKKQLSCNQEDKKKRDLIPDNKQVKSSSLDILHQMTLYSGLITLKE